MTQYSLVREFISSTPEDGFFCFSFRLFVYLFVLKGIELSPLDGKALPLKPMGLHSLSFFHGGFP